MPIPNRDENYTFPSTVSYDTFNSAGTLVTRVKNLVLNDKNHLHLIDRVSSVRTPGFLTYKRWNALPVNPYSKTSYVMTDPISAFTQVNRDGGWQTNHVFITNTQQWAPVLSQESSAFADDPTQKAVSRLIDQIGTAKADSATTLAEIGKTAQHLSLTATRIFNCLVALKKGNFAGFSKSLGVTYTTRDEKNFQRRYSRAVGSDELYWSKRRLGKFSRTKQESRVTDLAADTWLEYSYAWKPLLQDVYSHAEALAEALVEKSGVIRSVVATAKEEKFTIFHHILKDGNVPYGTRVDRVSTKNLCRFKLNYRIPDGSVSNAHVFGLSNPLTVAWELVPFSFVVDWFLPVGDALRGLSAFNGLVFHSGSLNRKSYYNAKREVNIHSYTVGSTSVAMSGTFKASLDSFDMSRVSLNDFPSYGLPQFKDPRSISHGLSAVALLQSLFLRR